MINKLRNNNIYKPSVLFCCVWLTCGFLYSLHLFSLPEVDDNIFVIMIVAVLSLITGATLVSTTNKRLVIGNREFFDKTINNSLFNCMLIAFFVIMLIPAIKAIMFISSGSNLYMIRYNLQSQIIGTGLVGILFNYFCEPFLTFLIVYTIANMFSNNRRTIYTVYTVFALLLITIISGGRFFVLYYVGALSVCFLLYRKKGRTNTYTDNKMYKRAKLLIFIAVIALIVVSVVRGSKITETIYVYFCGGIPFNEHLMEKFSNVNHTHGAATLYGFIRPIFVVFRKVGFSFPQWLVNIENLFLEIDAPYFLTPDILFNSFSTIFFAPYLDGGIIGTVIVFFILGSLGESAYKRLELDNEYSVAFFLLIVLIMILSFFRLLITHYSFALAFIYLMICHRKRREKSYE